MKLALVSEAPRTGRRPDLRYITSVIDAVDNLTNESTEWREFYAIDTPQPKAPSMAAVREQSPRLKAELKAWQPDTVVSLGKMALNAMGDGRLLVLKREHGRMRWLDFGDGEQLHIPWTPTVAPYSVIKQPDLHRDFSTVIHKALTQWGPLPEMRIETLVAHDWESLHDYLQVLEGASVIGVDVETGGFSAYSDDLNCVGFGAYGEDPDDGEPLGVAVIVPKPLLMDPLICDLMWDATWRLSRRSVGHNFKFDMQFLERLVGWAPDEALIGDTLLLAHLVDERPTRMNSRARGSGLKDLVAQRYDLEYGFDNFDKPYDDYTEEEIDQLHLYLGKDVAYTARLWHDLAQEADLESPRILGAHEAVLAPAAKAIARCELAGAPIDEAWVRETVDVISARIARRERALTAVLPSLAKTVEIDNLMSPTQIADLMYDDWNMTPDIRRRKIRSTDKDHMEAAVSKYRVRGGKLWREAGWLRSLQALRKDTKVLTTYQKSILDKLDDDGRVRASFLLHGTSTGRLSSQGPNLQNVPAVKRVGADQVRPMRRAFAPVPGRVWCDVDYSQLELRVAAGISGDQAFGEVFRSGRDVHTEIATSIFSKPADRISPAERFLAKSVSFGIIYGRTAKALTDGAEMDYAEREGMKRWDEDTAEAFIRKFLQSYPDLTAWISRMHSEVPAQGYVESPFGRRRRFPLIIDHPGVIGSIQRQAVNTPVQSAASDICLTALVEIQRELEGSDAIVLFPVHDSICIECAEGDVEQVEAICRRVMEKDWYGVPLTVDFSSGPDWATAGGWKG